MAAKRAAGSIDSAADIPDKPYFKIGEVAALIGVEAYVLRYWETEFKQQLRPEKTRTGQRAYRRRDVETALEIRRLVHEQGLRIDGARKLLSGRAAGEPELAAAAQTTRKLEARAKELASELNDHKRAVETERRASDAQRRAADGQRRDAERELAELAASATALLASLENVLDADEKA